MAGTKTRVRCCAGLRLLEQQAKEDEQKLAVLRGSRQRGLPPSTAVRAFSSKASGSLRTSSAKLVDGQPRAWITVPAAHDRWPVTGFLRKPSRTSRRSSNGRMRSSERRSVAGMRPCSPGRSWTWLRTPTAWALAPVRKSAWPRAPIISAIAGTASGGRLGRFIDPAMSSCSLTLFPPLEMVNTAFPVSVPSAAVVMPLSTATWAPVGNGSVSSDRPVKRGNAPDKLGNGSSRQDPALKLTNLVPYRCKDLGAGPGHLA